MQKMSVWVKKMSVTFSLLTLLCVSAPGLAFGDLTWSTLTPMPTARGYFNAVAADGLLYAVGGNTGGATDVVQAYDPATNTWTPKASLPTRIFGGAAGVIGDKIYVAGGAQSGTNPFTSLQIYDIQANSWSFGANMPVPNQSRVAGVIDGKLYVQIDNSTNFYAYDAANNSWTQKADAPASHTGAGTGVINGKLYVAGGYLSNRVDVYDPSTNSWNQVASMSGNRQAMASGVWNGHLYVAGGTTTGSDVLSSVEVYDPITDTWASDTAMLTARVGLSGDFLDGKFYAVGGHNGSRYVNTLEAGAVPIPGSVLLLGTGLAGLGAVGRRRRKG